MNTLHLIFIDELADQQSLLSSLLQAGSSGDCIVLITATASSVRQALAAVPSLPESALIHSLAIPAAESRYSEQQMTDSLQNQEMGEISLIEFRELNQLMAEYRRCVSWP